MTDTICALATGALPSAIAIVRLSGPAVRDLAKRHLDIEPAPARVARLATIRRTEGQPIDRGLVTFFAAPNSYTGEDMLELAVHGGRAIVAELVDTLIAGPGVRLAEPGEFTRRAFANGKLDLTEAEAVADLVDADTPGQRDQALAQLDGRLHETYEEWRQALIEILALVEVAVDFPDESDAPDSTDPMVCARLERLQTDLSGALSDDGLGERIRDGFRIALIGAPNAGKSSLLNHLAGRNAAIVTDRPGTTRDVIEVRLRLADHLALVSDTAGLRTSEDPIEQEGVRRARRAATEADLRVLVIDGTAPAYAHENMLEPEDLVVINKIDLGQPAGIDVSRETLPVSAKTGEGMADLVRALSGRISGRVTSAPPPLITRARHRTGLTAALKHLDTARHMIETGAGAELVAEDLRRAVRELTSLMGGIDVEEVLGAVFSQFCIGK